MPEATHASSRSITEKPTTPLTIPIREFNDIESMAMGFRSILIECEDGNVASGGGFGSPWIELNWKGRTVGIHAIELLAAWVRTFNPEDADAIEQATTSGGIGVQASSSPVEAP